jgi:hypothetical protein
MLLHPRPLRVISLMCSKNLQKFEYEGEAMFGDMKLRIFNNITPLKIFCLPFSLLWSESIKFVHLLILHRYECHGTECSARQIFFSHDPK